MVIFDEKSEGVIALKNQLLLHSVTSADDITFKSSIIITSDLRCDGKVTALFDLVVCGDVEAADLEVKGRFVCLGDCEINGSLVVQTDIWAENVKASSIICHDRIVAQSVDAGKVSSAGNIIIGKTLSIDEKAETLQCIVCGETAFGAGKIQASKILTADPLDLDEGTDAIESPFEYVPESVSAPSPSVDKEVAEYAANNNYKGLLEKLLSIPGDIEKNKFQKYYRVLTAVDSAYPSSVSDFTDVSLLLWLLEISHSEYFHNWPVIDEWTDAVKQHFVNTAEGKAYSLQDLKQLKRMLVGYVVFHKAFGVGEVISMRPCAGNKSNSLIAEIKFEQHGVKRFQVPEMMGFFSLVSEKRGASKEDIKKGVQCEIESYSEWLTALSLIQTYKDYLGQSLHDLIFDLLIEKIGLKAKFVEDRIKEKGWNDGK